MILSYLCRRLGAESLSLTIECVLDVSFHTDYDHRALPELL